MSTLDLDLSGAGTYLQSLAIVRQRIQLIRDGAIGSTGALALNVSVPYGGRVRLFMRTSDLYILAFTGKGGKVYVLADAGDAFQAALVAAGFAPTLDALAVLTLKGDHGSLGTSARRFGLTELFNCSNLSKYDGGDFGEVRGWLSILVCMLAEAARFLTVQNMFAGVARRPGVYAASVQIDKGLYGGDPVAVDEIVNHWMDGTRARSLASRAGLGVNAAKKICDELEPLLSSITAQLLKAGITLDRKPLLDVLINNKDGALGPIAGAAAVGHAKKLVQALRFTNANAASEFLSLFKKAMAIEAANGLLLPAV